MKPHLAGYRKKRSRFGSGIVTLVMLLSLLSVSYTHLTLPTNSLV